MYRQIEQALLAWKDDTDRLPLILRGARQVGKSYIVEHLGHTHFENVCVANFEYEPGLKRCFDTNVPQKIIQALSILLNVPIIPGRTLLFLDEIQDCPEAILALRYFKEKLPALHVIAAGSLLEFTLASAAFSFPVGRVAFMYMQPMSFTEVIAHWQQEALLSHFAEITLQDPIHHSIHEQALQLVRQYCLTGGMPAVVKRYTVVQNFSNCFERQKQLLQTYQHDFGKYARESQYRYLQATFMAAPQMTAQHFKYSKIDPDMRSRELKVAIQQLQWAGLIHLIYATNAAGLPFSYQEKRFKLLFLDIGLLQSALTNTAENILTWPWDNLMRGPIMEQFVGQSLLAQQSYSSPGQLAYWQRDAKSSQAEVDYVIEHKGMVIPIEVKSGKTGRLRSLQQFMASKSTPLGVKISQEPLQYDKQILSVPFYLISELPRLIDEAILLHNLT